MTTLGVTPSRALGISAQTQDTHSPLLNKYGIILFSSRRWQNVRRE
jgi:hypothetical protein